MLTTPLPTPKRQMNFLFSSDIIMMLNKYVPKGHQSQFVEESVKGALSSRRFQDALKKSFGAWKAPRPSTETLVRTFRKSSRP